MQPRNDRTIALQRRATTPSSGQLSMRALAESGLLQAFVGTVDSILKLFLIRESTYSSASKIGRALQENNELPHAIAWLKTIGLGFHAIPVSFPPRENLLISPFHRSHLRTGASDATSITQASFRFSTSL
jgi:hypothetical protein